MHSLHSTNARLSDSLHYHTPNRIKVEVIAKHAVKYCEKDISPIAKHTGKYEAIPNLNAQLTYVKGM